MKRAIYIIVLFFSFFNIYAQGKKYLYFEFEVNKYLSHSMDNKYMLLEKSSDNMYLYDVTSRIFRDKIPFIFQGPIGSKGLEFRRALFSPDNKSIYLEYFQRLFTPQYTIIYKYNYLGNQKTQVIKNDKDFTFQKFNSQNKYYATRTSIIDAATNNVLFNYKAYTLYFNHDGDKIAYIEYPDDHDYGNGFIIIKDIDLNKIQNKTPISSNNYRDGLIEYSPNDNLLAVVSERTADYKSQPCVSILNSQDLSQKYVFTFENRINSICFSPDNKYLICGSDGFYVYDLSNGHLKFKSEELDLSIESIFFTPDYKYFVTIENGPFYNSIIRYWDFISMMYSAELALEEKKVLNLFKPKDEFETQVQYELRKSESEVYRNQQIDKYHQIYLANLEKIKYKNEQENKLKNEKIRNSVTKINLSITELGTYNSEEQYFPVNFGSIKEKLFIPIDEAKSFKENLSSVKVRAEKQLLSDLTTWDVFNIQVVHPITGSVYILLEKKSNGFESINISAPLVKNAIPKLTANVKFIEPSGNNILDAKETGSFEVEISNQGLGSAQNIITELSTNVSSGMEFDKEKMLLEVLPGQKQSLVFKLKSDKFLKSGNAAFSINFKEKNGFQPDPLKISLNTQEFKPPKLVFLEAGISDNGNNIIENGEIISVTALIQNQGQGIAELSKAVFSKNDENIIFTTPNQVTQMLGTLMPGESKKLNFSFVVNKNYSGPVDLPINLILSEAENEYGGIFPLKLTMKKNMPSIVNVRVDGQYSNDVTIKEVSLISEVDKNIPETGAKNSDRFALIIGNEDYKSFQLDLNSEVNVLFAENDARIFKEYSVKTLGIPEENVTLLINATAGRMNQALAKMNLISKNSNGNAELIVYYAGHGLPDENIKEPYLIPVDVSGTNFKEGGIKLADVCKKLTEYPSKKVSVFIDACFSGGARDQGLLSARSVRIKPKEATPSGNIVVFSASSGEQSSLPYKDKQHGMFTYYLLKKIQETNGEISFKELSDYVKNQVSLQSVNINNKEQTPVISAGSDEWINWKLK